MIQISDANPVQFWLTGTPTFNEKVEPGIDPVCFPQIFNSDDVVKTQFTDLDVGLGPWDIVIRDFKTDEEYDFYPFALLPDTDNVWEVDFDFAGYDKRTVYLSICDALDHSVVHAKSDCIAVLDDTPNTKLIRYSNEGPYAGLNFTAESIFNFRVCAKFFKQRRPTTSESEPMTNGTIVKLSSTQKSQKLLQVEPAPFYIHDKINLILQCNSVFIDDVYWQCEEAYESQEMDERCALQLGVGWLSRQDVFIGNVFGQLTDI